MVQERPQGSLPALWEILRFHKAEQGPGEAWLGWNRAAGVSESLLLAAAREVLGFPFPPSLLPQLSAPGRKAPGVWDPVMALMGSQ